MSGSAISTNLSSKVWTGNLESFCTKSTSRTQVDSKGKKKHFTFKCGHVNVSL